MTKHIPVSDNGDGAEILPVRRRSKGDTTNTISVSIPKELNQTINGIAVNSNKSRSLVISELIEAGLSLEKGEE